MPDGATAGIGLPALAARAQLGDAEALESLLRQLEPGLRDHIRCLVRDDDDALDALQGALVLVYRRLRTLRDCQWVRAWAYRIATREAVRAATREARHRHEAFEDDTATDASVSIDEAALRASELARAMERVDRLPAAAQLVVRMHYLQELSLVEVAEALDVPLGTIKSRLAYGLARLRSELAPADPP